MRDTEPITKKKRKFKLLPESPADEFRDRRRKSEYGIRLEEKQKLKFIFSVTERQFRRYFKQAQQSAKNTGTKLLQILELRLDNVVYRLGFGKTRRAARQLVNHGHVLVNGNKVDVPSYQVKEKDQITLKEKALQIPSVIQGLEESKPEALPEWLKRKGKVGMVQSLPGEKDLRDDVDVSLIIEYYSRG